MCNFCNKKLRGKQRKWCSKSCRLKTSNAKFQSYKAQQERGTYRKQEAIDRRGGGCERCGYKKSRHALTFHHLRDKEMSLDLRSFSNNSVETISKELVKCRLLCMNCHMEEHYLTI